MKQPDDTLHSGSSDVPFTLWAAQLTFEDGTVGYMPKTWTDKAKAAGYSLQYARIFPTLKGVNLSGNDLVKLQRHLASFMKGHNFAIDYKPVQVEVKLKEGT